MVTPRVGQRFVRLDGPDLTLNSTPLCAETETVANNGLEVTLHEPLFDQMWLRERTPDFFRRERDVSFDNDGEGFGRGAAHLFIRSSRSSGALWLPHRRVQGHGGADERLQSLFIDLVALMKIDRTPGVAFKAGVEQACRILQRGALREGQLHDSLVGLAGTDDAGVLPHRHPSPLPLLDHFGVGLLDESSDRASISPRQSLSSLILASISREGESPAFPAFEPLVFFVMVVVAFF